MVSLGDEGSGLVGTVTGVAIFLSLLLLAVHTLLHLYATSVVTAVAFDAARIVSGAEHEDARGAAAADAETGARRLLGRYAAEVEFAWVSLGPEVIVLRVTADGPGILPRSVGALGGLDRVDRTVRVRAEGWR